MILTSKQKAYLRKLAHSVRPIVLIGKEGFNENTKKSILDAIKMRELIKIRINNNCKEELSEILEKITNWKEIEIAGIIGRTIIIFKENKEKPIISQAIKNL